MNYLVKIRGSAREDLLEAFQWYESQRDGLGSDFELCVEEGIGRISTYPEASAAVYKNIRRYLVRRFPYGIFYIIENNIVVVIAVVHLKRDTAIWKSRVETNA